MTDAVEHLDVAGFDVAGIVEADLVVDRMALDTAAKMDQLEGLLLLLAVVVDLVADLLEERA